MNGTILAAGVACFVCALGHGTIGVRWVLPMLEERSLSGTPFGPPAMTLGMLRFTWHVVTLMLIGFGVLLTALASEPSISTETLVLRWFAGLWIAAAVVAVGTARRNLDALFRLPVPVLFVVVAVLCWTASS